MHRKTLGKGLSDLLQAHHLSSSEEIQHIDLEKIQPNSLQPRKHFDEEQLKELSISIKDNGIIQPIIITNKNKHFEIVVGERRWRACKMLGLKTIPCIVKDFSDYKLLEIALIENIQRQDLNAIEEAMSYRELLTQAKLTQEELASRIGRTRTSITNTLRLLKLPDNIQQLIIQQQLSKGHARTLLALNHIDAHIQAVKDCVIQWNLSVRQTEKLIDAINQQTADGSEVNLNQLLEQLFSLKPSTPVATNKSTKPKLYSQEDIQRLKSLQLQLNHYLDTQVRIKPQKQGDQGLIQIRYKSQHDLARIMQLIDSNINNLDTPDETNE